MVVLPRDPLSKMPIDQSSDLQLLQRITEFKIKFEAMVNDGNGRCDVQRLDRTRSVGVTSSFQDNIQIVDRYFNSSGKEFLWISPVVGVSKIDVNATGESAEEV